MVPRICKELCSHCQAFDRVDQEGGSFCLVREEGASFLEFEGNPCKWTYAQVTRFWKDLWSHSRCLQPGHRRNSVDQHINSSFQSESQISESDEQALPAHHADVHEEPPTVSINELSLKAQASQSNEQAVPTEDAPSTVFLKQAKNNQVQVNS